jgi:transposase
VHSFAANHPDKRRRSAVVVWKVRTSLVTLPLEDANIKLDSVLTDLMGKSGRAIIEALIAGEINPVKLAGLADRRVKASPQEFREALRGRVTKRHRFLLRLHLNQIDALDAAMATLDAQVEANLGPFRTAVELIGSIPGIKKLGAHVIVSEIGIDMSRRPHISSRGPAYVHATTRVAATVDPIACARAVPGSKPRWCSAPGQR